MERTDLTQYDYKPACLVNYMRYNGAHFSKGLAEFACKRMYKKGNTGAKMSMPMATKEQVEAMLKEHGVELENNQLYDHVYVANMCKADFYGSSIEDDAHMAKYIKDVIDDPDGYDGMVFNRFIADCARKGIVIDWEEVL